MAETLNRPRVAKLEFPPYKEPPYTLKKSLLHNTQSPATEECDIVDIRKGGMSLNLADSIRSGIQKQHFNGHRTLPSLLLWDEQGLKFFEKVTYNPQYYLTNAEIDILRAHSVAIANLIEPGSIILELGSGALRKSNILLQALEAQAKDIDYYALDLDRNELVRTLRQLMPGNFKHVRCHGLLGTYEEGREWLSQAEKARRPTSVLSLGSTIGGFTRSEATDFLREWSSTLQQRGDEINSQLIIGLDGNKNSAEIFGAYNDRDGDNWCFVLNVLRHANRVLGYTAFHCLGWAVEGEWDAESGCHNQYIVPLEDVSFEGVRLKKGEKVFVCHSHKWNEAERKRLWKGGNLEEVQRFVAGDRHSYGVHILSPVAAQRASVS